MTVTAGQTIIASDFKNTSTGAGDAGKIPKLNSQGKLDSSFLKFSGTGSDGALTITSGTTTLDCASAKMLVKNYSSISITGTAKLAFINPHANGSKIILKSQGNVTITSSTVPAIDCSAMGAIYGAAYNAALGSNGGGSGSGGGSLTNAGSNGSAGLGSSNAGGNSLGFIGDIGSATGGGGGGAGGAGGAAYNSNVSLSDTYYQKVIVLMPAAGGGGGQGNTNDGGAGGRGGRGGGALYIECGGAYSCSSTISVAGEVGATATAGGSYYAGSGGGGGGGTLIILYSILTSNTGTYNVNGGAGGNSGTRVNAGGAGATGVSLIALNTEFA